MAEVRNEFSFVPKWNCQIPWIISYKRKLIEIYRMSGAGSRGNIVVLACPKVLEHSIARTNHWRPSYGALIRSRWYCSDDCRKTYLGLSHLQSLQRFFLRIWIFWNPMTSVFSKNVYHRKFDRKWTEFNEVKARFSSCMLPFERWKRHNC